MNLTITSSSSSTEDVIACDIYEWNGEVYTESGIYTFSLLNSEGCDSTASLNLTVLDLFVSTQTITSCGPYTWIDGITYEQSNSTAIFLEFSPDSLCTDTFLLDLTVLPISSSQTS